MHWKNTYKGVFVKKDREGDRGEMFLVEENVGGRRPHGFCSLDYTDEKGHTFSKKTAGIGKQGGESLPGVADLRWMPGILTSSGLVLGDITACLYLLGFSFSMCCFVSFHFQTDSHTIAKTGLKLIT